MGKWCPRCGAEYVEGWGDCSNCGVALVDTPPGRATNIRPDIALPEPPPPDTGEDPFVPIWEGPTTEATRLLGLVEAAHIPVDLGEALEAGHSRLEVPRSYVNEARDAIEGRTVSWPSPISDGPDVDYGRMFRLALVFVAVGLIVLMLFV